MEDKFNTIYTLDAEKKEGWNTGFVTEFVSKVDWQASATTTM